MVTDFVKDTYAFLLVVPFAYNFIENFPFDNRIYDLII